MGAIESGTSKSSGNVWQKCGFAVEIPSGQYPRKAYFTLFGDKVSQCPAVGAKVSVDFDVESREFNGRWYTDLRAWKVTHIETDAARIERESASQPQTPSQGWESLYRTPAVKQDPLPF